MNRQEKGAVLLKTTGILAAAISIVTLVSIVLSAKWSFYLLLPIYHIFLHIDLWVLFYSSRVYRDMKPSVLLVVGIVSVLLAGSVFVRSIVTFFVIPTLRTGLYLLAFPVTALFLIGLIIRGLPKSVE